MMVAAMAPLLLLALLSATGVTAQMEHGTGMPRWEPTYQMNRSTVRLPRIIHAQPPVSVRPPRSDCLQAGPSSLLTVPDDVQQHGGLRSRVREQVGDH